MLRIAESQGFEPQRCNINQVARYYFTDGCLPGIYNRKAFVAGLALAEPAGQRRL
jgi:hypothetical protein